MAVSASRASDIKAGGAYVELSTTDEKLRQGLVNAQNRLKKFSADIGALGVSFTKLGAGIIAPLGVATNQYATFSDKMLVVRARTKATDDEFSTLKNRVTELTRTTTFGANEIAEGMISLASMGMNPQQINGLIESMLNLARATGTELGTATQIAMNNLNVFKASVADAGNYVDIMSKTANGSAQILTDLGESLLYSASSAKDAGLDFTQLNAILATLANAGQRGSMAGTGLRNVFLSFTKNADKFKDYEIEIENVDHSLRSIPEIFEQINAKASQMPNMDRMKMFSELFGTRGLVTANILTNNISELQKFTDELKQSSGDAGITSRLMDSEIGGALRKVGNSFKGVSAEIGKAIANYITPLLGNVSKVVNSATDWVKRNNDVVVTVGKIGVASMALGVALLTLSKIIGLVVIPLKGLAFTIGLVGSAIRGFMFFLSMNPFSLWLVALGAVTLGFKAFAGEFDGFFAGMKESFANVVKDTKANVENIKYAFLNGKIEDAFKVVALNIKIIWHDLFDGLISYWKTLEEYISKGIAWVMSKFDKDLDFGTMSADIETMIADDIEQFKSAKDEYQKEINDIIDGIKAAKTTAADTENSTVGKGAIEDILGKIPAITDNLEDNVYNNPTFGSMSLDAINYGQPTYEINKKILNKLEEIERNTRDDDDDDAITVY